MARVVAASGSGGDGSRPVRARRRPWARGPSGLAIDGVPLAALVREFGSPLFVMNAAVVRAGLEDIQATLGAAGARLYLAGKSNPNPFVWRWLHGRGIHFDACSPGEVEQGRAAGIPDEHISFTGCALIADEMAYLAGTGVTINLDAADQALAFAGRFPGREFGLRINPGQGAGSHASCTTAGSESKLGIPWHEVPALVRTLRGTGAGLRGLHCHTGSGGLDAQHFVAVAEQMGRLAGEIGGLDWLSLGGGLGVPHHIDDEPFALETYAGAIAKLARHQPGAGPRGLEIRLEPGQFFVAEAGCMVARVVSKKRQEDGTRFALVDSSFNHYLGTGLYASWHEIAVDLPPGAPREAELEATHVCGHLCNTGDVFARGRELPRLELGDLLVMGTAGAYGLSRAANYNSRPIPAEVWVEDGVPRLIRRRQTVAELSAWYVG